MNIVALSKGSKTTKILEKIALTEGATFLNFDNADDLIESLGSIKADIVVLEEDLVQGAALEFLRNLRQQLPTEASLYLIVSFYSPLDLDTIRNIGYESILTPLSQHTLQERLFKTPKRDEKPTSHRVTEINLNEIVERLKPHLRKEIRKEARHVIKKFLEVLEREYEGDTDHSFRDL